MKKSTFLSSVIIVLLYISVVWIKQAEANTISGTVMYSDNNQIVTSGIVKAFDSYNNLIAIVPIQSDGTYTIVGLPEIELDIFGICNNEEEDYPPTYYPASQDPNGAVGIMASGNVVNRDIFVERLPGGGNAMFTSSVSGNVSVKGISLNEAVVYAKQNGRTVAYEITDSKGNYSMNLPIGDYNIVVHKLGYVSGLKNVSVSENGLMDVAFNLEKRNDNVTSSPKKFSLSQNYPNPFNPSTVISFKLAVNSFAKLVVYDILGKEVATLVNEQLDAGDYQYELNASNLSSGVYFYRIAIHSDKLTTGSFSETRKMNLVK